MSQKPGPEPSHPEPDPVPDPRFWGPPRPSAARRGVSFVERVRDRFGDGRAGMVLVVVAALVAGVVWYRAGSGGADTPSPPTTAAVPGDEEVTGASTSTTAPGAVDAPARVAVHVAGAVVRPGVVELPAGSRVIDALEAVGGAVAEADLDRLNLAAELADGQRVLVQRVGDPPAPTVTGGTTGPDAGELAAPLDLNTATAAELEELPGIGPTLAAAIIDERERRGGFRSVDDLRSVRGIGDKRFADLRDLVTVG